MVSIMKMSNNDSDFFQSQTKPAFIFTIMVRTLRASKQNTAVDLLFTLSAYVRESKFDYTNAQSSLR